MQYVKRNLAHVEAARALDRHLGRRLARRRRELGLSAADLDRALSGPPGGIARYENGSRSLGAAQLFTLSRALEVPLLFFRKRFVAARPGKEGLRPVKHAGGE
jgi:transcriptional regulator with XRE-family HTH domain